LVAAVPSDYAVIADSGSTNMLGYQIQVAPDGSASITMQPATEPTSPKPFTIPKAVVTRFFADLAAARKANLTTVPCMKSVSFGSTIRVTWQGWVSPDLTCPPKDALGTALVSDVQSIRDASGVGAAPLRRGPVETPRPD
jgi:hypothetical protein